MSTYVYKDKDGKFEIDITEMRSGVRVTLTDKGVTAQLCTTKNLAAAFEYIDTMYTAGGKVAPRREEWVVL